MTFKKATIYWTGWIQRHIYLGEAFLLPFIVLSGIMAYLDFAPFGPNSFATVDASIQYLDLFSFLKDVLNGQNNVFYTFSKTLGGNYFGVFTYYLTSPFNLLVVFFGKSELNTFYDLLVLIKIGLSGLTCAYFLQKRFNGTIPESYLVLLSTSYALMHYNIAQSGNIMWLDGVYMLPLILLGIYKLVNKNSVIMLAITVALSILFNWYTAGINCLFTCLWFVFELFYKSEENRYTKKEYIRKVLLFFAGMSIGVLLSAVLFVPTLMALKTGRAGIDWNLLKISLLGNPLWLIQNFVHGSVSDFGKVSLFCGSFVLAGVVLFFRDKAILKRNKISAAVMLLLGILVFYWSPLYFLFSLLKQVESYWYRYSYIIIFLLVFLAGEAYRKKNNRKLSLWFALTAVGLFSIILMALSLKNQINLKYVAFTIVIFAGIFFLLYKISYIKGKSRKYYLGGLILLTIFDLGLNAGLLMKGHHKDNVPEYQHYVQEQGVQIAKIKDRDPGIYRISQTSTRDMTRANLTANYNEAAAFNYWSISGYTSYPDNIQLDFLDQSGYRKNGVNMAIVNTSILPVDSLLGVKYILSRYPIKGLVAIPNISKSNKKLAYLNPYALPLAFRITGNINVGDPKIGIITKESFIARGFGRKDTSNIQINDSNNPFLYQNRLFGMLLGHPVKLFQPVPVKVEKKEKSIHYVLKATIEKQLSFYGDLPSEDELNGSLDINGKFATGYSQWLSPSAFYISMPPKGKPYTINLRVTKNIDKMLPPQFYSLNLTELGAATKELNDRKADKLKIENGYVKAEVFGQKGDFLFFSIPFDEGWSITRNGEAIAPVITAETFLTVPLVEGANKIEMRYKLPGLMMGIGLSILGMATLGIFLIYGRKIAAKNGIRLK